MSFSTATHVGATPADLPMDLTHSDIADINLQENIMQHDINTVDHMVASSDTATNSSAMNIATNHENEIDPAPAEVNTPAQADAANPNGGAYAATTEGATTALAAETTALADEPSSETTAANATTKTDNQLPVSDTPAPSASKDTADQAITFHFMERLGIAGLSYSDLKQLNSELGEAVLDRQKSELKSLLEDCTAKAAVLGVSERGLLDRMKSLLSHHALGRGLATQAGKGSISNDKSGKGPVVGETYRNPANGREWTRKRPQGSVNKEMLGCVQAGSLWEEIRVDG